MRKKLVFFVVVLCFLSLAVWGGLEFYQIAAPDSGTSLTVPVTAVKRGDVLFVVTAKGELQGGNSEMLIAPMTGGREMIVTTLRMPGELVKAGDLIVQFDTTEQEYEMKEAEADMAEAGQQIIQADRKSVV